MRVHVLQHVPFEDIAALEPELVKRGAAITHTRFYESADLPDPRGLNLVIAMGGPMSVNDEAELPWLVDEKRFLREAMAHGVPVLGFCLGAQLIASALGARVYPNAEREIGWFEIEATPTTSEGIFRFPDRTTVFHWHGETFDLPPGATQLARSAACERQAFQIGKNVIGLQFHPEGNSESVAALVENCGHELIPAPYVQTRERILAEPAATYSQAQELARALLDHVLSSR